jgi:hypothetical protein
MPFRENSPFFRPEVLAALTAAYNSAWHQLSDKSLAASRADVCREEKPRANNPRCRVRREQAQTAQRNCSTVYRSASRASGSVLLSDNGTHTAYRSCIGRP